MEKDTNSSILDCKKTSSSSSSSMHSISTTTAHPSFPSNFLIMGLHPEHHHHHHHLSSKNTTSVLQSTVSGGGITTEFPFTEAQWKELERQAMIYKCMISSVPVPHHLLFPLPTDFPSAYGGGYSRKGDPEPGRCKRTDGKKWRCSREVAPLQKYCERHLHRGRPRSRKPVELKNNNKKTRLDQTKNEPLALQKAKTDLTISTPPYYKPPPHRDLPQPWEDLNLMGDYNSSGFDQDYSALNLFSYPEMELPTRFKLSEGDDLSPSLNLSMSTAAAPLSWERGGPLGEALQPASPYDSMSTPATAASSPTGVLHWTLFSNSDGSVCSSPTLAAEIAYHWHI